MNGLLLYKYISMSSTKLANTEHIEQLRTLENNKLNR
jgi:CMP-2-keto-3-deoxyoctulosonic acid synthetase